MSLLSDRAWITKRCRMLAAERLSNNNRYSQELITYYSFLLVVVSVISLRYSDIFKDMAGVLLVLGSIAVLIMSLVISNKNYIERSINMKRSYLEIDMICDKSIAAEKVCDDNKLNDIFFEYNKILNNTENHSTYDYNCLCFSNRNNKSFTGKRLDLLELIELVGNKMLRSLLVVISFLFPLFVIAYYMITSHVGIR